jgi:hypothetical protein
MAWLSKFRPSKASPPAIVSSSASVSSRISIDAAFTTLLPEFLRGNFSIKPPIAALSEFFVASADM